LGVLLSSRGQFAEAAREMERSIALNPNDPAPHYRLARIYDRLGKTAEANAERELHKKLVVANAP
ncbi:MAG: tetratricopeptide repeat protein, partial [Bryobacteraceae bacterium]